MKISNISNLFCALALTLSLASFTTDKKKNREEKAEVNAVAFQSALYKINETSKVKLSVDKGADENLRITLRDKSGKVYYNENFVDKDGKYRRIFDLEEMGDGVYYFELIHNKTKVVKQVEIESSNEKLISLK